MNLRHLRQKLISIEFRQTVVLVDPMHQFSEGNAQRVVQRTVGAYGHDGVVVLELRPGDGAALDHAQLHPRLQRNFDGRAGDFSVAHGGAAVANIEQSSLHVHRKINGCPPTVVFYRVGNQQRLLVAAAAFPSTIPKQFSSSHKTSAPWRDCRTASCCTSGGGDSCWCRERATGRWARSRGAPAPGRGRRADRSEEHTSELQSLPARRSSDLCFMLHQRRW